MNPILMTQPEPPEYTVDNKHCSKIVWLTNLELALYEVRLRLVFNELSCSVILESSHWIDSPKCVHETASLLPCLELSWVSHSLLTAWFYSLRNANSHVLAQESVFYLISCLVENLLQRCLRS